MVLLKRADFNVEPLLEPFTRNCARNCRSRVGRNVAKLNHVDYAG
jgi:hypothetical protein